MNEITTSDGTAYVNAERDFELGDDETGTVLYKTTLPVGVYHISMRVTDRFDGRSVFATYTLTVQSP